MSKVATYLNEHLTGEVVIDGPMINRASSDGGMLFERPEMIVQAASTSDIRKVTRFCFQLAEKGHVLPITARGFGLNGTGAALSKGIIINQDKYMNRVIGIDAKQRLIHVQAGASYDGVNMVLSTQKAMTLPNTSYDGASGTVGGAIASGSVGLMSRRYGAVGDSVQQLEVVLATGEVLQTGRLSKRELSAKQGLHNLEGEIYRQIDNLITDNPDLVDQFGADSETSGYSGISKVKRKDGSFDLTPLFVGSQGTLGIISEVIFKAQFLRPELAVVMASYKTTAEAREAADLALAQKAVSVELVDGKILARAKSLGKKRDYAPKESLTGALVIAIYDDFSTKLREKNVKKFIKELKKNSEPVYLHETTFSSAELAEIYGLRSVAESSSISGEVVPSAFSGAWLPLVNLDTFLVELKKLEKTCSVRLPFWADLSSGFVDFMPVFDMKKVSDRQKYIKASTELYALIVKFKGTPAGRDGDGRIKPIFSQDNLSKEERDLSQQIKNIFDPYGILNPGVKQGMAVKDIVPQLNAWCRQIGK